MDTKDIRKTEHPEFITPSPDGQTEVGVEQQREQLAHFEGKNLESVRQALDQNNPVETAVAPKITESLPAARTEGSVTPLPEQDKGAALASILNGNREVTQDNVADVMDEVIGK